MDSFVLFAIYDSFKYYRGGVKCLGKPLKVKILWFRFMIDLVINTLLKIFLTIL